MFLEHLSSPFSISSKSNTGVLRITEMIKNVRRNVGRIYMLLLGK